MSELSRSAGTRRMRGLFVSVYLVVQIAVPLVGLYLAHEADAPVRYSWHMFSRVPDAEDE